MYKRILVPIDGTDTSKAGLREAIALATSQKATLRLLHLVSDFPILMEMSAGAIDFRQYEKELLGYGRKVLEDARSIAASADLRVETQLDVLKGGRVSDGILKDAVASGCDLIVIGTHGRRGVRRALLGSDAEAVLRESPVPVLLVRSARTDS